MATYEFKPDQGEVDDKSKIILKTIINPETEVVKEVTLSKLETWLAEMTADADLRLANIAELEAEIAKIKTDLNIK